VADDRILELYRREGDPQVYGEIRELWKKHSLAEDARDLPGLISTLTEDCVYELVGTEHHWEGHEGATRFYVGLLSAFPDITFDLSDIVIGPQGVCEEADVTGTPLGEWLGVAPTGEYLTWKVVIFFPWDPEQHLAPHGHVAGRARAVAQTARGGGGLAHGRLRTPRPLRRRVDRVYGPRRAPERDRGRLQMPRGLPCPTCIEGMRTMATPRCPRRRRAIC